ncbi:MAG: hypothetical protein ACRDSR_22640 [Pseudonocardiaceae bacterium]
MAEVTQDTVPTAPAARRDLSDARPRPERHPLSATGAGLPLIDSPAAAAQALCDYFLANADRGDHAANDELVAELVRRIRTEQASSDGGY